MVAFSPATAWACCSWARLYAARGARLPIGNSNHHADFVVDEVVPRRLVERLVRVGADPVHDVAERQIQLGKLLVLGLSHGHIGAGDAQFLFADFRAILQCDLHLTGRVEHELVQVGETCRDDLDRLTGLGGPGRS